MYSKDALQEKREERMKRKKEEGGRRGRIAKEKEKDVVRRGMLMKRKNEINKEDKVEERRGKEEKIPGKEDQEQ